MHYNIKKIDAGNTSNTTKKDTTQRKACSVSKSKDGSITNITKLNILNNGYMALALNKGKNIEEEIITNNAKKSVNTSQIIASEEGNLILNSLNKKQQAYDKSLQSTDPITDSNKKRFNINKSKERKVAPKFDRSINISNKPRRDLIPKSINQLEEIYSKKKDFVRAESNESKNYKILKKKSINIDTKSFHINKQNLTNPIRKSLEHGMNIVSENKNIAQKKLKIAINVSKIHNSQYKQANN